MNYNKMIFEKKVISIKLTTPVTSDFGEKSNNTKKYYQRKYYSENNEVSDDLQITPLKQCIQFAPCSDIAMTIHDMVVCSLGTFRTNKLTDKLLKASQIRNYY